MLNESASKRNTTIKVSMQTIEDINTLFNALVEGNSHISKQITKKASWNQKITAIIQDYKKIKGEGRSEP